MHVTVAAWAFVVRSAVGCDRGEVIGARLVAHEQQQN
jgi:hypothetical protein